MLSAIVMWLRQLHNFQSLLWHQFADMVHQCPVAVSQWRRWSAAWQTKSGLIGQKRGAVTCWHCDEAAAASAAVGLAHLSACWLCRQQLSACWSILTGRAAAAVAVAGDDYTSNTVSQWRTWQWDPKPIKCWLVYDFAIVLSTAAIIGQESFIVKVYRCVTACRQNLVYLSCTSEHL